jgi:hypothetical protein
VDSSNLRRKQVGEEIQYGIRTNGQSSLVRK